MRSLKLCSFFLLGMYSHLFSQLQIEKNIGFNIGLIGAFGTHINRVGIVLQGYGLYDFAQVNTSIRVYQNFKNLGPCGLYPELNMAIGLCLGYGTKTNKYNGFMSAIGNQTSYINSIAYSYNVWLNKIKTSQVTGIIAIQVNQFSIITENDLLAKPMLDRFRTGAFLIQYQEAQFQYAVNCTLWTGKMGSSVKNDSLYPGIGYINAVNGTYCNFSHGLLSAQIKYANEYGQYLQANAGVDAEQVRNIVQNKLIHDMPFIPKKWNTSKNLHIPMLDTTGNQYLYRNHQKIKKARLFLNSYASPHIFY